MKIQLTPALAKLVRQKMRTGHYVNESEVVGEALRIVVEHDEWHALEIKKQMEGSGEGIGRADRGVRAGNKPVAGRARARVKAVRKARKKAR